jgi:hypothetical protein
MPDMLSLPILPRVLMASRMVRIFHLPSGLVS